MVVSMAFVNNENTIPASIIVLFESPRSTLFANKITEKTVANPQINPITGKAIFPTNGIENPRIM